MFMHANFLVILMNLYLHVSNTEVIYITSNLSNLFLYLFFNIIRLCLWTIIGQHMSHIC